MGTILAPLRSGFMAYQYRCAAVQGDEGVNPTLNEWAAKGWELVTATVIVQPREIHYLYFRTETSQ
jgi:hypothetical protein